MKRMRIFSSLILVMGILYGNQQRPEMIPYMLAPFDYEPDDRLEVEIIIVHPLTTAGIPKVHRDEVLEIIYERIEFEILNPSSVGDIFVIDNKSYFLIRIPYTGAIW